MSFYDKPGQGLKLSKSADASGYRDHEQSHEINSWYFDLKCGCWDDWSGQFDANNLTPDLGDA